MLQVRGRWDGGHLAGGSVAGLLADRLTLVQLLLKHEDLLLDCVVAILQLSKHFLVFVVAANVLELLYYFELRLSKHIQLS